MSEPPHPRLIFLLGGARSGKSAHAEAWARQHGRRVLFVATAEAGDADMAQRIARHRADRPAAWSTLEVARAIGAPLAAALATTNYDTIVLDCLTLLAANVLLDLPASAAEDEATVAVLTEVEALLACVETSRATWLVVSNEVGLGIVPPTHLGRVFRDVLGRANQRLAQQADEVVLLVAGLPWRLKEVSRNGHQ